jgi:hypothetical protein
MTIDIEGSKCARCGEPLQDGYVIAPKGLWYDTERHKFAMVLAGLGEKIVSPWKLTVPSTPAQRCYKCNIVIIPVQ